MSKERQQGHEYEGGKCSGAGYKGGGWDQKQKSDGTGEDQEKFAARIAAINKDVETLAMSNAQKRKKLEAPRAFNERLKQKVHVAEVRARARVKVQQKKDAIAQKDSMISTAAGPPRQMQLPKKHTIPLSGEGIAAQQKPAAPVSQLSGTAIPSGQG